MNKKPAIYSISRVLLALTVLAGTLHQSTVPAVAATQFDIRGPAGSVRFGTSVAVLPNGNIVVTDPHYDGGMGVKAGAVYLYHGATGALISMLTGTRAGDSVGSGGVTVLSNGNYLVRSRWWDNGAILDAGAVTWGNGASGVSGPVSALNSLVGSQANDQVGYDGVIALSNGNYVVCSASWDNGSALDAGAATWGNGAGGVTGPVSPLNSLVGSQANDRVGHWCDVTELSNGNYVVRSSYWDNGASADAGAVTWGNGLSGVSGPVSALNSLVGSSVNDNVGGVIALSNGNYVVFSSDWDNGAIVNAGAVTWGNGASGVSGPVSALNSLVGSQDYDGVGSYGVTALSNGNYVVSSISWKNGDIAQAGAVTWGDGTSGVTGPVTVANSLVGSQANDQVGYEGVTALSNGNYVVRSRFWDNAGIADVGAVTWGDGTSGVAGPVTVANSLVGSRAGDQVGYRAGNPGVTALSNGNYVVHSPHWDNAGIADAGAATWGFGASGVTGPVSAVNSLVGSQANDQVGSAGVTALSNGNYVVSSPAWNNGAIAAAGAVTWGAGTAGVTGTVTANNSLVGSQDNDQVGFQGVTALGNGNYVVKSRYWDNALSADAGAVTWDFGESGTFGSINAGNSVRGLAAGGGIYLVFQYDASNRQLVVGRPADNIVTLFKLKSEVYLPVVSK
jgi:hypothetical protein